MSLFEDEDEDVGRFVMGEDGEEWFPFMFENLEGDRGCLPMQQVVKPMEQVRALAQRKRITAYRWCVCKVRQTPLVWLPGLSTVDKRFIRFRSSFRGYMEAIPRSFPAYLVDPPRNTQSSLFQSDRVGNAKILLPSFTRRDPHPRQSNYSAHLEGLCITSVQVYILSV